MNTKFYIKFVADLLRNCLSAPGLEAIACVGVGSMFFWRNRTYLFIVLL